MRSVADFKDIQAPTPSFGVLTSKYQALVDRLTDAKTYTEEEGVLSDWQKLGDELSTWSSLTSLHFEQDTQNKVYKQELDFRDEIMPKLQAFDVKLKQHMLTSTHRAQHEQKHGEHLFDLWEVDTESFRPEIQDELIALNKLVAEHTELLAGAEFELDGETYNLSGLRKFSEDPNREMRERAERAKWDWFKTHGDEFDRIYDDMVKLRHQAAQKLGYKDFVELGYKLMQRIDYTREDVEKFRHEVRRVVVPLCKEMRAFQAKQLGIERMKVWDMELFAPEGNPEPKGDHDWMIARAKKMFNEMGHGLGEFFTMMADQGFLDLKARKGKSGGGFCTAFPSEKVPFVFANFNGTSHDVRVFTHEIGHAFQCWQSAELSMPDYYWPTYESAEIHSMSLEFLTWPHMDKFFEDDADRFRLLHLMEGIIFLPYGVAVDHFQHMVYEEPEATPERRRQMWKECEELYLPWMDWDTIEHGNQGGRWHLQSHIFQVPFYYIDYTLAQSCALQLWKKSTEDFDATMETYNTLCKLGGSKPFLELVKQAGLVSPFSVGGLEGVMAHARDVLSPVLDD